MSADLLIWLTDDPEGPWQWQQGEVGGVAHTSDDKSGLAGRGADNVYALMSGQSVNVFDHALPAMRERERLSAAGFSIEDKIAAPLSEQHIVLGVGDDKRIAVISHTKMKMLTSALSKTGLQITGLFADFDVLPKNDNPTYLEDRTVHTGPSGYTTDRDWGLSEESAHLPSLLSNIQMSSALNLMQGIYSVKRSRLNDVSGLKRIAALILCAGVAGLVFLSMESRALNAQADDLRVKMATLYTQATGSPAPANPALAVTRAASSASNTQADFLGLSDILFRAVDASPNVSIDSLQFDGQADQLTLRLIYPRFESASELEQVVKQLGGTLRPGGVREQNGRLIGDAVLTRGGS